jgi:hypothetical protein
MKLRTWLFIGAAAVLMFVVSCGVIVGGAAYLIGKRVHIDMHASEREAETSIERILEGFADKTPLIASHEDPDVIREELHKRAESYTGAPPQALHVLVWNPSDEKLVRFHLPFWLLKMKPVGPLDLDAGDFRLRRFRVSAQDLQRAGPLLIIDLREDNARVLVWTE